MSVAIAFDPEFILDMTKFCAIETKDGEKAFCYCNLHQDQYGNITLNAFRHKLYDVEDVEKEALP